MSEELINMLKELRAAGQTGMVILIVGLIIIILSTLWMIWLQRQSINRFEFLLKSVDTQIKAADSIRAESRASQEISMTILKDQLDAVIKTNEELRKEIERIDAKQEGLKESVKAAISTGLEEVKDRLNKITVTEFLNEIPEKFRSDLEAEIVTASERIMRDFIKNINEMPDVKLNEETVKIIVERIEQIAERALYNKYLIMLNDQTFERLAYEIAHDLELANLEVLPDNLDNFPKRPEAREMIFYIARKIVWHIEVMRRRPRSYY